MLKKTHLLSLVTLLFLAMYLIGMHFAFANSKIIVWNDFDSAVYSISEDIGQFLEIAADNGTVNLTPYELANELSNLSSCPYTVYIVDESQQPVARTGDTIHWQERDRTKVCFISDYLNDDIKEKLCNASLYGEKYFYYLEDDNGKIIPVTLVYKDPDNNNYVSEIKFSDYDQYSDDNKQFGTYLTVNGVLTQKVYSINTHIEIDLNELMCENYQKQDYQYTRDAIFEGDRLVYTDADDYWAEGECKSGEFPIVLEDGKTYFIYFDAKIRPDVYAMHEYPFVTQAKIMTAVFVISLAVTFAVIELFYKKQLFNQSKYDFANAAAHELKTPLSIIQNQCELIIEGVNAERTDDYIHSIYEESVRMNKLVQSLMQYNSVSANSKIKKTTCNLSELAENEISKYQTAARSNNLTIRAVLDKDCVVRCNAELISRVIDNFLSNAVKFAVPDSEIVVVLKKQNKKTQLSVFNKGDGISDDLAKNLWELLYRGDENRSSADNSNGMGLAISKRILELHKYKYGYVNSNGGVEFYFIAQ